MIGEIRFQIAQKQFCTAAILLGMLVVTSCASGHTQYAAHGYLTPGPTSEPEIIGIYESVSECREAADNWASRQIVGNPIHAECYPVDRD